MNKCILSLFLQAIFIVSAWATSTSRVLNISLLSELPALIVDSVRYYTYNNIKIN